MATEAQLPPPARSLGGPVASCLDLWAVAVVLLACLGILLAAPFLGGPTAFRRVISLAVQHLFRLFGLALRLRGWEALPDEIRSGQRPVLFLSNHESNLDPPLLVHLIPFPVAFLSKREILWMPVLGWAAWVGDTIFLDRGSRESARLSLLRAARLVQAGRSVVIFPEGTRTRDGQLGAFKKGGFVLAMAAGVPIVPVAVAGGFGVLPAGARRIRTGRFEVAFGEPVDPSGFESREALMAEVRERIVALREGLRT